jgi:hypothetical protein
MNKERTMNPALKPVPDEPDFLKGYAHGLAYQIIRHPVMGHLCGYVKLTKHHPLYKAATSKEIRPSWRKPGKVETTRRGYNIPDLMHLDVHGGVTFFGKLKRGRGYWVGFDCAHSDDLVPGMSWMSRSMLVGMEYRDVAYVKREIVQLAQQLAGFGNYQNRRG